jgi:Rrf2 family protein
MLKLSKKIEYGLLAVQHMAVAQGKVVSAKDVAETFGISQALVAKVLQSLVREGIVTSFHGANGGYTLTRPAEKVSVADVIHAIDGHEAGIVECQHHDGTDCSVHETCTIRKPLTVLQERINATFAAMSVAELSEQSDFIQLEVS